MRSRILLLVVLFSVVTLLAGEKVNFTGIWNLNVNKCSLDDFGTQFVQNKMVITQQDNNLTIIKNIPNEYQGDMEIEETLTLDGKENKSQFWNSPRITTAKWSTKNDTLTIFSKIEMNMDGKTSVMTLKDKWSLQDEGEILSIIFSSTSSFGDRKLTLIFDKVE